MLLSVVLPCFSEEPGLKETHSRLVQALQGITSDYELIYVDDGSEDKTFQILTELNKSDPRVRVLRLSRNYGHQIAVTAGINHSSGDAVVVIDSDLQDPPEIIKKMVELWREGYDVVYGQRTEREGESGFKIRSAKLYYWLFNKLSDRQIPPEGGDFRLIDRKVANALNQMLERDRFLRGMVSWAGFRQISLPYRRQARGQGVSKYSLRKMLKLAADGILSFSFAPLRAALVLGFITTALALAGVFYALVRRLFSGAAISGWGLLFFGLLFVAGVQLTCLGVLGEYVGRIYRESKRRPLYLLQERLGFEDQSEERPR
jgi:glycosyltransferase involved in cell wall biosynthesis